MGKNIIGTSNWVVNNVTSNALREHIVGLFLMYNNYDKWFYVVYDLLIVLKCVVVNTYTYIPPPPFCFSFLLACFFCYVWIIGLVGPS